MCCLAFLWTGVRQAQATVVQWESQLVSRGAIQVGLHHDGKCAVYRFALGAPHCRGNVIIYNVKHISFTKHNT
jgi:hypothetical protein